MLREQINTVFQEGFEIPLASLTPEAHLFTDLKLDSLDAIDLLVHLEEKLGVKVDSERFQNVRTLGDVYNMVDELAATRPNA